VSLRRRATRWSAPTSTIGAYGEAGQDFLRQARPRAKHIVTNPPYGQGLADEFIRRALILTRESGGKVAMLLNLASLAHATRTPRWRATPPVRLYAIDSVTCWPDPDRAPPETFSPSTVIAGPCGSQITKATRCSGGFQQANSAMASRDAAYRLAQFGGLRGRGRRDSSGRR
jgi:hypothetical protein